MLRISDFVEQTVLDTPFLEEALGLGLINLSALARRLKPRVEKALVRKVSTSAVTMALKRLSVKLARAKPLPPTRLPKAGDLTVRSNLMEFTFQNSSSIWAKQKRLLGRIEGSEETFVTCTQGVSEVMLMVSAGLEKTVSEIFAGEHVVSRLRNLSAIVIRLSPLTVRTPGAYYAILKRLAWQDLNVIDVVSTYTEFTIILEKDQVDPAFSALRRYLWP
jgi:hypothetical protein